jgi:hypothetical protein
MIELNVKIYFDEKDKSTHIEWIQKTDEKKYSKENEVLDKIEQFFKTVLKK